MLPQRRSGFTLVELLVVVTILAVLVALLLPAILIMAVTLVAAIWTHLQGLLLTAQALAFFIAAMMLIRFHARRWNWPWIGSWAGTVRWNDLEEHEEREGRICYNFLSDPSCSSCPSWLLTWYSV